jgi:hypothetical protein
MEMSHRLGTAGKAKGTGMSARKIRTAVGRLVVIGSLAIAVIAGSIGMNAPSKASAMPDLTSCYTAFRLGQIWQSYGDLMWAYGNYSEARVAYAVANSYRSVCDGGPA